MSVDTDAPEAAEVTEAAGALMGRLFESTLGTLEVATVWLGVRLGFYDHLHEPCTATDLATAAGVLPRYAREWLEQQAIAGLVSVDGASDADARRFWLDPAQRAVLGDRDGPLSAVPMALLAGGCGAALPRVLEAWRRGEGLGFTEYGDDVRTGQGMFNRGAYDALLVQEWLPAMPDVQAALRRQDARAIDIGCGVGWSTLALVRGFQGLRVLGTDSDEPSILDARAHAVEAGVGERARFEVARADSGLPPASYDVVFFFECLHDLAHPVETLRAVREALRPGGRVVVMDERTEEAFAPDGPPLERLLGAASVLHCLPVGLSEPGSAGTGALMRPDVLRGYAREAGFSEVTEPPIEHDMMRFYVLTP